MTGRRKSYSEEEVREAIRAELKSYVDSTPPPPMLVGVRQRVLARTVTDTGRHDIEELQRQLQERLEKAAAERVEEAERKYEKLVEQVDMDRRERRGHVWDFIIGGVFFIAGILIDHFLK